MKHEMKHEVTCQELNDEQLEEVVGGQLTPTVTIPNTAAAAGAGSNNAAFAGQANQALVALPTR